MSKPKLKLLPLTVKADMLLPAAFLISLIIHMSVFLYRGCQPGYATQIPLESFKAKFTLINFQSGSGNTGYGTLSELSPKESSRTPDESDRDKNRTGEEISGASASYSDAAEAVAKGYEGEVLKRIHRMKYYPAYAKRMGFEGVVTLKFTLYKNGTLRGAPAVVNSCANDILNRAGIKTVMDASPFPSFPADMAEATESRTFFVTVDYNIRKF